MVGGHVAFKTLKFATVAFRGIENISYYYVTPLFRTTSEDEDEDDSSSSLVDVPAKTGSRLEISYYNG